MTPDEKTRGGEVEAPGEAVGEREGVEEERGRLREREEVVEEGREEKEEATGKEGELGQDSGGKFRPKAWHYASRYNKNGKNYKTVICP